MLFTPLLKPFEKKLRRAMDSRSRFNYKFYKSVFAGGQADDWKQPKV